MNISGLFNKADKQQNPYTPKAELAYEKGLFKEAASFYAKAVEAEPANPTLWMNFGTTCRMLQNYEKAEQAYAKVVEIDPDNRQAWINLAILFGDSGRFDEAVSALSHVVLTDSEAYLKDRKCEWLQRSAKYQEAASVAQHLTILFPDNPIYKSQYASLLMRSGSFAEAKKLFDELAAGNPMNRARYIADAGFCAEMMGDTQAALKCYKELDENDSVGWYRRALIEEAEFNFKEAAIAYNMVQFSSDNADDITVAIRRAFCLFWAGQGKEAAGLLEKVISKGYATPELWYALGSISFLNGSLKRAVEAFDEYAHLASSINPNQYLNGQAGSAVWYMKGCAEYLLGKYANAIKSLNQSVRAGTTSTTKMKWFTDEGDFTLFDALAQKESDKKSIDFAKINEPLETILATANFYLGKFGETVKSARNILDNSPDRFDIEMLNARALKRLGLYRSAAESAARVLAHDSENPAALGELADCKAALGMFSEADEAWKKLAELEPNNKRAQVQSVLSSISLSDFNNVNDKVKKLLETSFVADITLIIAAAEAAVRAGQYEEAVNYYLKAVAISPTTPACWLGLGHAYEMYGDYGNAVESYSKAAELLSNSPVVLLSLARVLEASGDKRNALSVLLKAVNSAPELPGVAAKTAKLAFDLNEYATAVDAVLVAKNNGETSFDLALVGGKSCAALDRLEDAVTYYLEAQKFRPDNLEVLLLLGQANIDRGRFDEAMQCAQIVLGNESDNIRALFIKGYAADNLGVLSEAEKAYKHITELDPGNTKALIALANVYLEMRKYDDVLEVFGKYINNDPANTDIIRKSTTIYILKGDYDEALAGYNLLLEANPGDLVILRKKAEVLAYTGKYEDAAKICAKLLSYRPDDIVLRTLYARVLANFGDSEGAVREYAEITLKEPGNADALFGYADMLSRLGRYPEAIRYYAKLIELYPRNSLSYLEKTFCAIKIGDPRMVLSELSQTVIADPKNPHVLSGLGFLHLTTGHPNEALQFFDKAEAAGCSDADLDYCRGLVHLQMCRFDLAVRSADKIIEKQPEHIPAWHLKAKALEGAGELRKALECFKKIDKLVAKEDAVAKEKDNDTLSAFVADVARGPETEVVKAPQEEVSVEHNNNQESSINGYMF